MIPKRIFTTWICSPEGDLYTEEHRAILAKCLTSWLRLMPDYRIEIVTLGNLFDHGRDAWVQDRLRDHNYIGASQWARLFWLQRFGGIYVDMDVEAIQRFDSLLTESFVVGHMGFRQFSNNAVMASVPDHPFLGEQMVRVKGANPEDREFGNLTGPFQLTTLLRQRGWSGVDEDATVPHPAGSIVVRRSSVFHPYPWTRAFDARTDIHPDTLAVHHWGKSWREREKHMKAAG